jgi:two-component system chemotaxis response regulator CheY
MDGQTALVRLRDLEEAYGVTGQQACTIFMVSALDTEQQIVKAFFRGGCTDFLTKPVTRARVQAKLREYGLIAPPSGGATA